jgi:hypothetical protein
MLVEMRPIGTIRPYKNNPRLNDAAVDAVAASVGTEEQWAAIPGFEGLYEVSTFGRVRRSSPCRMAPAGHLLKPRRTWDGYVKYALCKRRRYRHVKAHRLVALAFLGPPPFAGAHVAHHDGNKTNNRLPNLRWATPAENEADKVRHGTKRGARPGELHHLAKLTAAKVAAMRHSAAAGESIAAIARRLGVSVPTAYGAIYGTTWNTVTEPPPLPRRRRAAS